jgi:hypothetical protein
MRKAMLVFDMKYKQFWPFKNACVSGNVFFARIQIELGRADVEHTFVENPSLCTVDPSFRQGSSELFRTCLVSLHALW